MRYGRGFLAVLALLLIGLSLPSFGQAKGGGDITYGGQTKPAVTFKHSVHTQNFKCTDCHPKVFKMKKNTTGFTMDDIKAGKACGTCHNGTAAFSANDEAQCVKCHAASSSESPSPSPSASASPH